MNIIKQIIAKSIEKSYRVMQDIHHRRMMSLELATFWARHSEESVAADSYHPEEEHKPIGQIHREIEALYCTDRGKARPEEIYNSYMMVGLDCVGKHVEDYLFRTEFTALVNKNKPSYAAMLNNKIFTLVYLSARGIPVSEILGQVDDEGMFRSMDGTEVVNFHDWMTKRRDPVFCKQPDGYQGTSCFVLEKETDHYLVSGKSSTRQELEALLPHLQIETLITQHPHMAAIYPDSVNTCRMVTVAIRGKVQFFSGYALFGCNGARVSNGCSGGILVPFSPDGKLGDYGVRELKWGGGRFAKHPGTGAVFADCRIPYFEDVMQLAIQAHRTMPTIRSVAWDIAVTPTGPIIIEANQGWACVEHQIFNGGLRQKAESLLG